MFFPVGVPLLAQTCEFGVEACALAGSLPGKGFQFLDFFLVAVDLLTEFQGLLELFFVGIVRAVRFFITGFRELLLQVANAGQGKTARLRDGENG